MCITYLKNIQIHMIVLYNNKNRKEFPNKDINKEKDCYEVLETIWVHTINLYNLLEMWIDIKTY